MFRIDPSDELASAILQLVAQRPGLSVAELHAALKKKKSVTLQHLYRKLNQLIAEEVIIKHQAVLTANLMWLSYLQYFAAEAKAALAKNTMLDVFPLKQGQRIAFSAKSMSEVQTLWHHLLVQLHRQLPQKKLHKYYSHAWWVWNKRTLDVAFYKKILAAGVRCLWLYGNNTYLDRAAVTMSPDLIDSRIALDAPFPAEGYNLNVYGDYVFECSFPAHIARHLDLVFSSVRSQEKKDLAIIDNIFAMESEFTVTIWNNPTLALKFQKSIERYFLFGAKLMPDEDVTRN